MLAEWCKHRFPGSTCDSQVFEQEVQFVLQALTVLAEVCLVKGLQRRMWQWAKGKTPHSMARDNSHEAQQCKRTHVIHCKGQR